MDGFVEASAPGRLDFMGGIADYSGALVLQLPIRERVKVRLRLRKDQMCNIESKLAEGNVLKASLDYRKFLLHGKVDYPFARQQFRTDRASSWTSYILGCALVLQKEKDIPFRGADIIVESNLPVGKGVASSAALEIATMRALEEAFGITIDAKERAALAQRAENLVVGAPCGLMDQLASSCGEAGKLLPVICQPDTVLPSMPIPEGLLIAGIDSGTRHAVGDTSYTNVRCAAFMGYTIIAQTSGASRRDLNHARESGDWSNLPFMGYLCNIPVDDFESQYAPLLPESLTGEDFIGQFGLTNDPVTSIDPRVTYAVRACASHPVYEDWRVEQVADALALLYAYRDVDRVKFCRKIGRLMHESHESYSRCGLGSSRTDALVAAAKENADDGIYGAKITGGGSGGTVCFLADPDKGGRAIHAMHQHFSKTWGEQLKLFI